MRISPEQACDETRTRLEPLDISVWVCSNGVWNAMSPELISRLWAPHTNRSLCYLLFREVFGMSGSQYENFRHKLQSPGLTGIYKGSLGQYVIVVQLDELLRPEDSVENPSYAELPFFSKPSPKSLAGPLSYLGKFQASDYDPAYCLQVAMKPGTAMNVLAFYYFKILAEKRRKDVFLCNGVIIYRPYELMPRIENASKYIRQRRDFHKAVNSFLASVPNTAKMGVCLLSTGDHATMLVFDVAENRLEFYDPNGRDATYYGEFGDQTRTPYAYFARNARKLSSMHPKLCKVWAPDFQFQHEQASCAMWSTGIAICRMSGIDRAKLSTSIEDMRLISAAIRTSLVATCQFSSFAQGTPYIAVEIDRALAECKVPHADCQQMTELVRNCERLEPMLIPNDVDVCGDLIQRGNPIDCNDVRIDVYESDVDVDALQGACDRMGPITFRGTPTQFPSKLYTSTNSITFQPRSHFVSLNFDTGQMASGLAQNKDLRIRFGVGFVDLSKPSVVDSKDWDHIQSRLKVDRVLVVGALPDDYKEKVEKLSQITTPYVHLNTELKDVRKLQLPFEHFAVFNKNISDAMAEWLRGRDVYYSLDQFENGRP